MFPISGIQPLGGNTYEIISCSDSHAASYHRPCSGTVKWLIRHFERGRREQRPVLGCEHEPGAIEYRRIDEHRIEYRHRWVEQQHGIELNNWLRYAGHYRIFEYRFVGKRLRQHASGRHAELLKRPWSN
jgi:hypothetical protein